jgi:hypothetical protein
VECSETGLIIPGSSVIGIPVKLEVNPTLNASDVGVGEPISSPASNNVGAVAKAPGVGGTGEAKAYAVLYEAREGSWRLSLGGMLEVCWRVGIGTEG